MDTQNIERILREMQSQAATTATDVKHILLKQDKQDARIERINTRLSSVEAFQYKLIGIATIVPIVISSIGLAIRLTT